MHACFALKFFLNQTCLLVLLSVLVLKPVRNSAQTKTAAVLLNFQHYAGNEELAFDTEYSNPAGEIFSINKFRYYISNIALYDSVNNRHVVNGADYFLIDEKVASSKSIILNFSPGIYKAISFVIGVDSIRNVSGAQSGALDPLNDMFWTWKSGYVMAKMEGQSKVSTLPHHIIEYHIGGFKGKYNALQVITLTFSTPVAISGDQPGVIIQIKADINKWFNSAHSLSIAQYPACTSEGELAQRFSENYRNMFSIEKIITK
ncbi:MAG: hypothetical protein QM768_18865 [Agriterribacter sp.]